MIFSTDQTQELPNDTQLPSRTVTVAFQGELGTFGDEAVQSYFRQPKADPISYHSFIDVFRAVAAGEVDYGLVPVENSQLGSINDVYDLLRKHDLFVIGEMSHQINQCLLTLPEQQLSDIKRVISHPQALAQSEVFLRELEVESIATYDTTGSAKQIHDEQLQGVAIIASSAACELYKLEILVHGIQTIKDNHTRFIAIGPNPAPRCEVPAKTMLVMATSHQPGSLCKCLGILAAKQINLLKLESHPSRQRAWEYVFYLDLEGHREDPAVRSALADLVAYTTFCKVLGSFASNL